jgi:hypothetical protein
LELQIKFVKKNKAKIIKEFKTEKEREKKLAEVA